MNDFFLTEVEKKYTVMLSKEICEVSNLAFLWTLQNISDVATHLHPYLSFYSILDLLE
jgi:hypothetical protein